MHNNLIIRCKTNIRKFPAILYLIFICIGIVIVEYIAISESFLILFLLISLSIVLILYLIRKRTVQVIIDLFLILSLLAASMFTFAIRDHCFIDEEVCEEEIEHFGMLLQNPIKEGRYKIFKLHMINKNNGNFFPFVTKVSMGKIDNRIEYGDVIRFKGKVQVPQDERNPGTFNYRNFLKRNGIHSITYLKEENVDVIGHLKVNPFFRKLVIPVKEYCRKVLSKNLDDVHSSLLKGLTLGLRGSIPKEVKDIFSDAGVIHILAVSGLHVGIISLFLFILFRSVHIPFNISIFLTCLLLVMYAFLTDLRPSVVRATIMFIFIMIGMLSQRRVVLLNIIAGSAVVILVLNPLDLFDPGFQLSYAATFAIVILANRIYDCFPKRMKDIRILRVFLILPLSVSIAAQLGTAPIVAFYFYKLPIIAPIANITIVPLVSLAIPLGFLTVIGDIIHPVVSRILAGSNWFLLHLIIKTSTYFSGFQRLLLWVRRPSLLFFALYYPILFAFFVLPLRKRIKFGIISSLVVLNIFIFNRTLKVFHPELIVSFLDVSQGDASIIEFPGREVCIVDGGRCSNYADYGKRVVIPFLRSKGIKSINTIIATHPDVDHYGGLISVVENFKVGKLLINGSPKATFLYNKLLEKAENKGIPIYKISSGDVIWIGEYPLYVFNPPRDRDLEFLSSNESSIVFKFGYGDVTFLFTGDFQNRIIGLPSIFLQSTVLKFPHHGARLYDERGFLSAVHPMITTISVGRDNPFGHPSQKGISILDSLNCNIFRTDRDGAITITTNGQIIRTKKMIR